MRYHWTLFNSETLLNVIETSPLNNFNSVALYNYAVYFYHTKYIIQIEGLEITRQSIRHFRFYGRDSNYNLGNSTVCYRAWVGLRYIQFGTLLPRKYRPGKRVLNIVLALKRAILVFSVLSLYEDYSHSWRVCWILTVLKMIFVWSHGNLVYTAIGIR